MQEIYYVTEMVVGVAAKISIVTVPIELRQNTYFHRKSMRDEREQRSMVNGDDLQLHRLQGGYDACW